MNRFWNKQPAQSFLVLAISMVTCLILLIDVSFKMINLSNLFFATNSLLCPLITGLYLIALRNCSINEQRHLLNISLISLYIFCIGIYVLINIPAAEYMHDNPVYQIVFEDIPRKFFATTIAFALSFYLPHLFFCIRRHQVLSPVKQCVLTLLSGLSFFCLNFFLLFYDLHTQSFKQVFTDSLVIASLMLLIIGVIYLSSISRNKHHIPLTPNPENKIGSVDNSSLKTLRPAACPRDPVILFDAQSCCINTDRSGSRGQTAGRRELNCQQPLVPLYQYLLGFAVAVMLLCLVCEYRIVAFNNDYILSASSIFFPITLVISTLIGETLGYRANLKLALVLITTQLIFDSLLMSLVALPSPPFFNLNPYYNYIIPRRLPASSLALLVTFMSNAFLLHYLKQSKWKIPRSLRVMIATVFANSLLCLVDYSLLFWGIYPYEQIMTLAVNVWQYKLIMSLISLPIILWLCDVIQSKVNENTIMTPIRTR